MINTVKILAIVVVIFALSAGSYYVLQDNRNLGGTTAVTQNGGNLNLFVSDAPINNVSAVYLTFSIISLYENFKGWTNYTIGQETVNILNISTSNASLLKGLTLSPQQDNAIGVKVTKAIATVNGANETFSLASNNALVSHSFSIVQNKTTNVNIEFNLASDLNMNDKVFTPNIASAFTAGIPDSHDNGTLNMAVFDAPPQYNVSAVYLSFSNISLNGVQTGWTNYTLGNRTINIFNLSAQNASLLKSLSLGPQEYTMIRLYINNVTVTVNGTNETFSLASPFAFVNHPFNVTTTGTTNVNIQFNLTSDLNLHAKILTPKVGTTFTQ